MVSVLNMIGLMCLLDMVPRGKIEPEFVVGHTRIIKDNPNYIYLHVRDDIINGGPIKDLPLLHAARETEPAVTWPVPGQTCPSEWPPWPNFGRDSRRHCGAFEASWGNGTLFEGHDWHSKLHRATLGMEQKYQFYITAQTERGFLEKNRMETRETEQRERSTKSQMSKHKAKQEPEQTQSQTTTTEAAESFQQTFVDFSLQTWLMAMAMANLTSRDTPRPIYRNDSEKAEPKISINFFTNESCTLCNHNHFARHPSNFVAVSLLCILWTVACIQAAWHFGLTAAVMKRDMLRSANHNNYIINPVEMRSAVTMIDLIQTRQSCMHKVVYTICERCKAWMCISCGMITVCSHHCIMEELMAGCWDEYRHRGFNTLCARASSLNTSLHFNEFDMIFEEMSVSLVEYLSARCGAINCDDSNLLGYDQSTGDSIDNLQPYAGARIYKTIHACSVYHASKICVLLTKMMRNAYLIDAYRYVPQQFREPKYFTLFTCIMCKLKCRVKYCLQCDAAICLVCGTISACVCNYGTNDVIGAHEWLADWIDIIDRRQAQQDITFIHDRMHNPLQSPIELCPLCTARNDMGCFLEYGVGRLFITCFGCNRKYCSSAKPGTDPRYTPCQFSMQCTCHTHRGRI